MQNDSRYPITKNTSCNYIRRIMKEEIDSSPTDERGKDIENDLVSREPEGQKGGHHEGISRMSARETGINHLSASLGKL